MKKKYNPTFFVCCQESMLITKDVVVISPVPKSWRKSARRKSRKGQFFLTCKYKILITQFCRQQRGAGGGDSDDSSDESSEEEVKKKGSDDSESSGSESDSDDGDRKAKGVSGLIEIENPNRVHRKAAEKITKVNISEPASASGGGGGGGSSSGGGGGGGSGSGSSKPELSRREREELDKQRRNANYQKLHAEGKTDQARADLARLAIIKQHRAEAAARRDAEKKGLQARNIIKKNSLN